MIHKYPCLKPKFPIPGWLLVTLVPVGLFSLWMSAYQAFQNVTEWKPHAAGLATLIEGGAFVTAFVWAKKRGWKNWESVGMVIMILTSASYQYTQASQAAAGINLIWFEVYALAWGPLVALVLIAFVLANIDTAFQKALSGWQENKTAWEIGKQAEAETEARRLADTTRLRLQAIEDRKIAASEAADLRDERRKVKQEKEARKLKQPPELLPEPAGSVAEVVEVLPEWIDRKPKSEAEFIEMAEKGEVRLGGVSGPKLAAIMGKSARTNQKLLGKAKAAVKANGHKKEIA